MPQYRYKARDKDGALQSGMMEAAKKDAVADQLSSMGYIPVRIEEQARSRFDVNDLMQRLQKVTSQDLIVFSRQLSTLMGAGVPFVQSLATIERQTENSRLKAAIVDMRKNVEAGAAFSDALARHPGIFSKMYVSMIRAGETAGILDDILERLALLAEHDAETRARVKAAVRYPLIVVVAVCLAFAFLVSFVIPKFAALYSRFKTELPMPTRVLIGINYVVQNYWYLVLLGLVLFAGGVIWYLRTQRGRWQWDRIKLKLPVFGMLFQKVAFSRFARVFGAMQKSGISMMLTLEIVAETVGNVVIARVVDQMREDLREGKGLVEPMEASGMFPPLVIQMISVGEETGNIDTMLAKVSDYYDMDVEYTLRNLSTLIEPILLLFLGGMVLFMALGIFLPMWNMISLFKK
ncbi:MAG TPA: type II secretion system F family protein [Nitrospirota bacterium]|nr:type II secretion system F family protein [Nitrospirota bacterium]